MLFGVNFNQRQPFMAAVKPVTILRTYKSWQAGWPALASAWPAGAVPHWSIRPTYTEVTSGAIDGALRAAFAHAEPGSLLTLWHEPELALKDGGPTPTELAAMYQHVHPLVKATSGKVLLGPVGTAHAAADWWVPGLDFYGVDDYNWGGHMTVPPQPRTDLTAWWAKLRKAGCAGPTVIAETNTMHPGQRPEWFTGAFDWLQANGGIALETFWLPTGKLSGPFLPADTKTIDALNSIAAQAAALP